MEDEISQRRRCGVIVEVMMRERSDVQGREMRARLIG
jgi:hypothetical protein